MFWLSSSCNSSGQSPVPCASTTCKPEQYADVRRVVFAVQVEKKENYDIMVTLRAKIDELRKQNDAEYQEYIKRDRAFRGYQREQRRKQ